jgi:hypothetical protein
MAITAFLGLVLSAGLAAQGAQKHWDALSGAMKATATVYTPCYVGTTDAMLARSRFYRPPSQLIIMPRHERDFEEQEGLGPLFPGPSESYATPGDPTVAAGPRYVVAAINETIAFYNKTGSKTFSVDPAVFFAGLISQYCIEGGWGDCRCWYDTSIRRFWITYDSNSASTSSPSDTSYLLTALSDDDNPNGIWATWALNMRLDGSSDGAHWCDFPGLGGTKDVLCVTGDMVPITSGSYYAKLRIMDKQQFLEGASDITWTDFWNITNPGGGAPWAVQPARVLGDSAMPLFVCNNLPPSNKLNLFGVQDPLTNPSLVKRWASLPYYTSPSGLSQRGTTIKLDTAGAAVSDVLQRDGMLTFSHHLSDATGCRAGWYVVDVSDFPNSAYLVLWGSVQDATQGVAYGALVMNQYGTLGTGLTMSSASTYPSLWYTGHIDGEANGTMHTPTLWKTASNCYTGEGSATVRWGDYEGGCVDPADDYTFWAIGMLPATGNPSRWTTEVYSYQIGEIQATLTGRITLDQYTGSPAGLNSVIEFRYPGTTTAYRTYPFTLDSGGCYALPAVLPGTWDVAVKLPTFLRDVVPSATIAEGSNTLDFECINGDAYSDNAVDLLDLHHVLTYFGTTGAGGGDLDGNRSVDLLDLNIVLLNFGLIGDN